MAEHIQPVETAANVYERTIAEIEALRSYKPKTRAEERHRSSELVRLKRVQLDLAQRVIEENAAQQIAEIIGNDHATPRLNGSGKGHAPAAEPVNWAQAIVEVELRCERQIAALKEHVSELVASKSREPISEGELVALAKGLRTWLDPQHVDILKRVDELETVVRTLVQSAAGRHE